MGAGGDGCESQGSHCQEGGTPHPPFSPCRHLRGTAEGGSNTLLPLGVAVPGSCLGAASSEKMVLGEGGARSSYVSKPPCPAPSSCPMRSLGARPQGSSSGLEFMKVLSPCVPVPSLPFPRGSVPASHRPELRQQRGARDQPRRYLCDRSEAPRTPACAGGLLEPKAPPRPRPSQFTRDSHCQVVGSPSSSHCTCTATTSTTK